MSTLVNCDSETEWKAYLVRNPAMRRWTEYRPRGTWALKDVTRRPPSDRQQVLFSGLSRETVARVLERVATDPTNEPREGPAWKGPLARYPMIGAWAASAAVDRAALDDDRPDDREITLRYFSRTGRVLGETYSFTFGTCEALNPSPATLPLDAVRASHLNELAEIFSGPQVCAVYLKSNQQIAPDRTPAECRRLQSWLENRWGPKTEHPHPVIFADVDPDAFEKTIARLQRLFAQ